jgi:acetoin:2,6-dichlorophenolindophenol oxidoreductase subunit alpha
MKQCDETRQRLAAFYRTMLLIRLVEERIGDLVTNGEVGCPCHLYIGQEAIAAGACAPLQPGDTVWGTHRSHGHYLARGASLEGLIAEILGRASGCAAGRGGSMHLLAREQGILGTVPLVAATIPLAVGAGLAHKLRGDKAVAMAFFGDGATEEGHFHESLNFAALHKLPVIFVCENNFYASHLHLLERRPADNLETIAAMYQLPGIRLDGNDVEAVYQAADDAVRRARNGAGPTLLECRTFRWRGHVGPGWDMDVGVHRRGELREWMEKCPIARAKRRLGELGMAEGDFSAVERSLHCELAEAEARARQSPLPNAEELLDHVFYTKGAEDAAT